MSCIYLDGEYLKNNPAYHVEDSPWKAQQILRMLNKHQLRPASIAEVGCGAGEILKQLQLQLPQHVVFHGFEISPQAFDLCKQRENDRLHFHCEDLLASSAEGFDLLLCIDVIEHVEDYMGFLRKLRPRAVYKVFHIPLELTAQSVLRARPIVHSRSRVGHLHYFFKDTALLTLQDTGYEVVDWFYTPAGIDRAQTLKSKLASLPRWALFHVAPDAAVRTLGGYSLLVLAK